MTGQELKTAGYLWEFRTVATEWYHSHYVGDRLRHSDESGMPPSKLPTQGYWVPCWLQGLRKIGSGLDWIKRFDADLELRTAFETVYRLGGSKTERDLYLWLLEQTKLSAPEL